MPELPEVEALVGFLRERTAGLVVARVDVGNISVLKTYDPPPSALAGLPVTGVARHGKFVDLDIEGLHLVFHLARAGWLRWSDKLAPAPLRPGKSPIGLRVHALRRLGLRPDRGRHPQAAGGVRRARPGRGARHRDARPRPARPGVRPGGPRRACSPAGARR